MKVGDKVVYIEKDLPDIGLYNNDVYRIEATSECNCKDNLHIDVGISLPPDRKFTFCPDCLTIAAMEDNWFFHNSGFRLLQPNEEIEIVEREIQSNVLGI